MKLRGVKALLDRAIALVRGGWTQGVYARTGTGEEISVIHPAACMFCLSGAITRASFGRKNEVRLADAARRAVDRVLDSQVPGCRTLYNDAPNRTKEDVIKVLKRAKSEVTC